MLPKESTTSALAAANRFDELQLIGGASSIQAVVETISQAANCSM
jgi:hypothetical protein